MQSTKKILFLLKQSDVYGNYSSSTSKSGILNSAKITAFQITKYLGVNTSVEVCVDGNEIDKYVFSYKPNVVIIEALWATPAKLLQLTKLYPKITFIVLVHSNVAFLANEGIAIQWIKEYELIENVRIGFNSQDALYDFQQIGIQGLYLPNIYYDVAFLNKNYQLGKTINVGCFGSIRPLKNQLIQCFAAIELANKLGKRLNFHINSTRPEQGGQQVLKNIRSLFAGRSHYSLVEHEWEERDLFLALISSMDIGMQVSFSETFNIVAADFVIENIPIIVSSQISWMPHSEQASMYSIDDMVNKMERALSKPGASAKANIQAITKFNILSLHAWGNYIKSLK